MIRKPFAFLLRRMFGFVSQTNFYFSTGNIDHELTPICSVVGKDVRDKIMECALLRRFRRRFHNWAEIDTTPRLTDEERRELYAYLVKEAHIPEFRAEMRRWLAKRKAGRRRDFLARLSPETVLFHGFR